MLEKWNNVQNDFSHKNTKSTILLMSALKMYRTKTIRLVHIKTSVANYPKRPEASRKP